MAISAVRVGRQVGNVDTYYQPEYRVQHHFIEGSLWALRAWEVMQRHLSFDVGPDKKQQAQPAKVLAYLTANESQMDVRLYLEKQYAFGWTESDEFAFLRFLPKESAMIFRLLIDNKEYWVRVVFPKRRVSF